MTTSPELVAGPAWDIADRMRKALRQSGIGVQEIAEYLGVTRTTVGNWINGRSRPSKQTLRLWAMQTGVPFAWLDQPDPDNGPTAVPPAGVEPATNRLEGCTFQRPAGAPDRRRSHRGLRIADRPAPQIGDDRDRMAA